MKSALTNSFELIFELSHMIASSDSKVEIRIISLIENIGGFAVPIARIEARP